MRRLLLRAYATLMLLAAACVLGACTTPAQLAMALIPDGTLSVLMSHFEREVSTNRKRVAELEQKGDWPGLVKFAEDNIAKDPRTAAWWMVKGYAHSQQKQHANAIAAFGEMVSLEPNAPDAWNLLAQEHRNAGDPHRALVVLDNAMLALRDSPTTFVLLGDTLTDLSRHEEALRAYRQAIELNDGLASAWSGYASSLIRLGRVKEAEEVAVKVEKVWPELARGIRQNLKKP